MEASILDFRRRSREIIEALERGEIVTVFYRGKKKGVMYPAGTDGEVGKSASDHPAFGMWKDRDDLADVDGAVRKLRKGRFDDV